MVIAQIFFSQTWPQISKNSENNISVDYNTSQRT